jgi:hypothetical protein
LRTVDGATPLVKVAAGTNVFVNYDGEFAKTIFKVVVKFCTSGKLQRCSICKSSWLEMNRLIQQNDQATPLFAPLNNCIKTIIVIDGVGFTMKNNLEI